MQNKAAVHLLPVTRETRAALCTAGKETHRITVREVRKREASLLDADLQNYLAELSSVYEETPDASGRFSYPYLPLYFTEADRRACFFFCRGERVGFALLNVFSVTGDPIDRAVAEFTIFPAYRRRGYAAAAVRALFAAEKGIWQLKYAERNLPAARFWQTIGRQYGARETALPDGETALTFFERGCPLPQRKESL